MTSSDADAGYVGSCDQATELGADTVRCRCFIYFTLRYGIFLMNLISSHDTTDLKQGTLKRFGVTRWRSGTFHVATHRYKFTMAPWTLKGKEGQKRSNEPGRMILHKE